MTENPSKTLKENKDETNTISDKLEVAPSDNQNLEKSDNSYEEKDIPSADSSSSRKNNDLENVGFTQEEFASLLGKYDYNFKPGDLVKGTVFALEPKGAMIDIGAKTAAFMPMQEVSINRVEGLSDV